MGKSGGSELFFLGAPLEVMGARGGLGERSCSGQGGARGPPAHSGVVKPSSEAVGRDCNSSALP